MSNVLLTKGILENLMFAIKLGNLMLGNLIFVMTSLVIKT